MKTTIQIYKEDLSALQRIKKQYGLTHYRQIKEAILHLNSKYPPKLKKNEE